MELISRQTLVFYTSSNETDQIEPKENKIHESKMGVGWGINKEDREGIVREVEGNQEHRVSRRQGERGNQKE